MRGGECKKAQQTKTWLKGEEKEILRDVILSAQFICSVVFNSLWPHEPQHARPSITNSRSSPELMCIESVMPFNYLILHRPLLLLTSIFPSIRVFSNESALRRWPKYWSFSFSISPSNEHPGLISFRIDCYISLQSKGLSRVFSNTTVQKHQFFSTQPSLWSNSYDIDIHTYTYK